MELIFFSNVTHVRTENRDLYGHTVE